MTDATDDRSRRPLIEPDRANTILYCGAWQAAVGFYRDQLGLPVTHATEWFVEFRLTDASHISVADARRASIDAVDGQGITLSWRVPDLQATRLRLLRHGLGPSGIRTVWGADVCYLTDPEGHRIELWADDAHG